MHIKINKIYLKASFYKVFMKVNNRNINLIEMNFFDITYLLIHFTLICHILIIFLVIVSKHLIWV